MTLVVIAFQMPGPLLEGGLLLGLHWLWWLIWIAIVVGLVWALWRMFAKKRPTHGEADRHRLVSPRD